MKLVLPRFTTAASLSEFASLLQTELGRSEKDRIRYAFRVLGSATSFADLRVDMLQKQGALLGNLEAKARLLDSMSLQLRYTFRDDSANLAEMQSKIAAMRKVVGNRLKDLLLENEKLAKGLLPKPSKRLVSAVLDGVKAKLKGRLPVATTHTGVGVRGDSVVFSTSLLMKSVVDDTGFNHPELTLNIQQVFDREGSLFSNGNIAFFSTKPVLPESPVLGEFVTFSTSDEGVAGAISLMQRGKFASLLDALPVPPLADFSAIRSKYVKAISVVSNRVILVLSPQVRRGDLQKVTSVLVKAVSALLAPYTAGRLKYQTDRVGANFQLTFMLVAPPTPALDVNHAKELSDVVVKSLVQMGFTPSDLDRLRSFLNGGVQWRK